MRKQYYKAGELDFGAEVAKVLPLIMREFAKMQNVLSKGQLSVPQVVILELLAEHGHCRMSELAKSLNFTMSAVTAIIDKMIELKLVKRERSSQDRRVVNVIVLNKGREMAGHIRQARRDCANILFSVLTEDDKKRYVRILKKVYDNLVKKNEKE